MKKASIILLFFFIVLCFVGIIDKGNEFVDMELCLKYPTIKMFFTTKDHDIINLNEKLGMLGFILPYFLLQLFFTSIFIKLGFGEVFKSYILGLVLFSVLLLILIFFVNIALFYNINILSISIVVGILAANYFFINFYNNKIL